MNRSRKDYKIGFKKPANMKSYGLAKDYSPAPDRNWLKFIKDRIKLKGRKIEDIKMSLEIPDGDEYRGKNYAFVIVAEILELGIPVQLFARIYVKTEE